MAENKRITLHPLKEDGTLDLNINLYPKAPLDGIIDRETGEAVEVALKNEIPTNYMTIDTEQIFSASKVFYKHLPEGGISIENKIDSNGFTSNLSSYSILYGQSIIDGTGLHFSGVNGTLELSNDQFEHFSIIDDSELSRYIIKHGQSAEANYSLSLPNKTGTIATTDDCGTKLYLHTITTVNTPAGESLCVISSRSEKYAEDSQPFGQFTNNIAIDLKFVSSYIFSIATKKNVVHFGPGICKYMESTGTITDFELDGMAETTDTVTPL